MKKATAILLLVSLLLHCFTYYSVIALYELRKDYIAKNLCENRNKPTLKCNGKCYLQKQLKNTNIPKNAHSGREKIELLPFIISNQLRIEPIIRVWLAAIYNPVLQSLYNTMSPHSIFRPPDRQCYLW